MPRGLRHRLRIHAAVLDREISEVIAQAVTEYLDRHDQQREQQGLPPIPLR
jgi:predicted transcriptional regulator